MDEVTAYHEAGHAVMAARLGGVVRSITIDPERDAGPNLAGGAEVGWPRERWTEKQLAKRLVRVSLAGPVAEMLYTGDTYHPGVIAEWASDWRDAWSMAAPLVAEEPRRLVYLEQVTRELYAELDAEPLWSAVAAVADHLLAHDHLDREEFEEILESWLE